MNAKVQIESPVFADLYDSKDLKFKSVENVIKLKNTSIICHSFILMKTKYDAVQKYGFSDETITNFIKLLYGHVLDLSFDELIDVYKFGITVEYLDIDKILKILIKHLNDLSDVQLTQILNIQSDDASLAKIVKNISLQRIRQIICNVNNITTLRLFTLESIIRYKELSVECTRLNDVNNKNKWISNLFT